MSSPALANIITVNTIKSADATNLTINSPGGTINTNATNITASGALSLATSSNNILSLSPNGTGYVNISNTGLRLPNGATTLNWYEEATLTGTWSNTTTPAVTSTVYIVRVGKQITLQIVSPYITSTVGIPSFSATLPSKFYPISSIVCPISSGNLSSIISISNTGVIKLSTYSVGNLNNVEIHTSYYTNTVTGASGGVSGQDSGSDSGGASRGGASGSSGSDPGT